MGYRCYIHPVTGTEPDIGEDACIGKLIGYVSDDHINDLSVLPFIAFGLQYGQQHGADLDVDTMDVLGRWMNDETSTLGSYMDVIDYQRIVLPGYLLLLFLGAYYNDQQAYYIKHNAQPALKMYEALSFQKVLLWYSDLTKIVKDGKWAPDMDYLIYWC